MNPDQIESVRKAMRETRRREDWADLEVLGAPIIAGPADVLLREEHIEWLDDVVSKRKDGWTVFVQGGAIQGQMECKLAIYPETDITRELQERNVICLDGHGAVKISDHGKRLLRLSVKSEQGANRATTPRQSAYRIDRKPPAS